MRVEDERVEKKCELRCASRGGVRVEKECEYRKRVEKVCE